MTTHWCKVLLEAGSGNEGGGGGDGSGGSGGGQGGGAAGGAGGGNTFLATLPEEIRSEASLQSFADPGALAKSYVNAQKMLGGRIALPGEKATEKDWSEFYTKIGRPETADKYALPKDIKLHEALSIDEAKLKTTFEGFHKMGLTGKQAEGVMSIYLNSLNEQATAVAGSRENETANNMTALKTEFGDDAQNKLDFAKSVIKMHGSDELLTFLNDTGLGNNVHLVKLLSTVGEMMVEDSAGGKGAGLSVGGPAEAAGVIEQKKQDAKFMAAVFNREDPTHAAALREWVALHARAYPGQQPPERQ
jgi:hypothetical protein